MYYGKRVFHLKDLPATAHFAVISEESFSEAGYGPNDPPSTGYAISYRAFDNQERLEAWIRQEHDLEQSQWHTRTQYRVISVKPVSVNLQTSINIES